MRGEVDPSVLQGHGCASYEESGPSEMVFRPSTYNFRPSRGLRTCFKLKPDGTYSESGAGPDDRRHQRISNWARVRSASLLDPDRDGTFVNESTVPATECRMCYYQAGDVAPRNPRHG
jgi:hypothetical protein